MEPAPQSLQIFGIFKASLVTEPEGRGQNLDDHVGVVDLVNEPECIDRLYELEIVGTDTEVQKDFCSYASHVGHVTYHSREPGRDTLCRTSSYRSQLNLSVPSARGTRADHMDDLMFIVRP